MQCLFIKAFTAAKKCTTFQDFMSTRFSGLKVSEMECDKSGHGVCLKCMSRTIKPIYIYIYVCFGLFPFPYYPNFFTATLKFLLTFQKNFFIARNLPYL